MIDEDDNNNKETSAINQAQSHEDYIAEETGQAMALNQKVREARQRVHNAILLSKMLAPSAEITLARRQLQTTFHWLGETLGWLKEANPYPESFNPESDKIEPLSDADDSVRLGFKETTHIGQVKALRALIKEVILPLIQEIYNFIHSFDDRYVRQSTSILGNHLHIIIATNFYTAIIEAKNWLGWELGRIREEAENAAQAGIPS